MNDRWLISSFTASSLIHLGLIPVAALVMHAKPIKPVTVPIEIVEIPRVEQPSKVEVAPPPLPPPPPAQKPKPGPEKMTAPKLISKPEIIETKPQPPVGNTKEEIKEPEPEPIIEPPPPLASLPEKPGLFRAAGIPAPARARPKAAPPARGIFSTKAMSAWSAAVVSKEAVAARG